MSCQSENNNNNNNNNMMRKLKHFLLQFDQPQRVLIPGDLVSGHLIVDLNEQINFSKIKVEVAGRADVHWRETVRVPLTVQVNKHSHLSREFQPSM